MFSPSLGAETFLCICLFGENESLLTACTAFPPQPAAHQQCAQILPTGQQRKERQLEPLFLSLKSPTETSQDKTENGNTWQITWGNCRVAAPHQRSSNMIQGGSRSSKRSSSLWSTALRKHIRDVCKRAGVAEHIWPWAK